MYYFGCGNPNTDRDMNRDNIVRGESTVGLRRSAPRALSTAVISALKPGRTLADGAIRPGSGSLKIRKRQTVGGVVPEWLFEWHRAGKTVRQSIGRYSVNEAPGCLTLAQARVVAAGLQETVRAGENPVHKRDLERDEAKVRQSAAVTLMRSANERTLSALLAAYIKSLSANGKHDSSYDANNLFSNHVEKPFPELAALPADQISPSHVARILSRLVGPDVVKKKGRTALKLRSYLGAAFKLALGASTDPMAPDGAAGFGLSGNPAAAVPATNMAAAFNKPGKRTLSEAELFHFLAHLEAWPSTLQRLALKLQIVTAGQRMQQLLRISHADAQTQTLTLRDSKGRRSVARLHVLPIIPEIAEILSELKDLSPVEDGDESGLLFASRGAVVAPETLSGVVLDICTAMLSWTENGKKAPHAVGPFRGGDVRRTVETMLSGTLRISKDIRAQLLSHGLTGVQDVVYDQALHLEAKASALRIWNDFLTDLCIGQETTSNVMNLHRAA